MRLPLSLPLLLSLAACQTTDDGVLSDDPGPAGSFQTVPLAVEDVEDLAARLQGAGVEMELESYSTINARTTSGATYALPGDDTLVIVQYASAAARDADLGVLAAETSPGGVASVYTAADRFAVVYSGTDADTRAALADLLDPVE
jgi:hypothetical protein